jgi:methylene-fatty-acyl-phospholipid synthase
MALHKTSISLAAVGVAACPVIWNILARNEYRRGTLTRLFGNARRGCYALAMWIFLSSLLRDKLVEIAMRKNLDYKIVHSPQAASYLRHAGWVLFAAGMTLVSSAYYRLGVTGTYLGDYFGILMDEKVSSFPFSHFENPMYLGASIGFLSLALHLNSAVGVGLAAWVYAVYGVSTRYYEGPFTAMIYSKAAAAKASAKRE